MMNIVTPMDAEKSIKKFNFGGEIMPLEVKQELEDFKKMVSSDISESDKVFFNKAIASIESKYGTPDLFDSESEIDEDSIEDNTYSYLSNGNWYKQHPEKLLGEIVIKTDMRGNEIRILKGDLSELEKIKASDDFEQFEKELISSVSVIKEDLSENTVHPETEKFIYDIIEKSNVEIGKKAVRKTVKKQERVLTNDDDYIPKIRDFKTVSNELNKDISLEEMRCYVWYKEEIDQPLSSEWYDLVDDIDDKRTGIEKRNEWVKSGILFYFKGEYLPLPIYVSGDVYEKINRVVKTSDNNGADASYISSTFGEDVLNKQIKILNEGFKKVYSKRLVLTGNEDDNSLVLKPISTFAKTFKISETQSNDEFKWNVSKKSANSGDIDFYSTNTTSYKMKDFAELSLVDAFVLWMAQNREKIAFKGNISWNDIYYYYIQGRFKQCGARCSPEEVKRFKANQSRIKSNAQAEGDRLFLQFLSEELSLNQKVQVETQWNSTLNNYLAPDFNKIPVAFNVTENLGSEVPFEIKWEKREAVAFLFNEGSGCLAYDVGVGKTMSAIMTTEQFLVAGYCKRPFIVVPNQTYRQWLSEIKAVLPHRKVNGLFNLGVDYIGEAQDEFGDTRMLDEGSISVMTYEGFAKIGFNEDTQEELLTELYDILNQGGADDLSDKKKAGFYEKLEKIVGTGLKGTMVEIEKLGLDYVCYDEAHAMKKVFTSVKSRDAEEGSSKRGKSQYSIQSGTPSDTALKGFMISNYILKTNNYRNVVLLTATPFTNSPLEVFSMLAIVGYRHIELLGLKNINDFFDNFIDVKSELVINHKLKPEFKQVIKGFNNLPSLQRIVLRFFNYKDSEDVGVVRPSKIVIPYTKKLVNGNIVTLEDKDQVTCNISMSAPQKEYMEEVIAYVEGRAIELGADNNGNGDWDEEQSETFDSEASEIDESSLDSSEKAGVKALRGMNFARNIALSPYLYQYQRLGNPDYKSYINTSPKLQYVVGCVESVKKYHESKDEPVSGQVIYMDRGLKYFSLIEEYLVKVIGFKPHEVGQISSKMSTDKKRIVQDLFLGRKYNNKTQSYESVSDDARIKVLIGSSSIKEGMNLQKKSTVLYNCFLDWNPTDIIQLQGRIWRQQNEYLYVRIVNPLVIDSMDIFMFQKLEEKTARLNSIWSNDGKSVMKLEEMDTEEIKMSLVKDPKVIAGFESKTKKTVLEDNKNSIKVMLDRLKDYKSSKGTIENRKSDIDLIVNEFAPQRVKGSDVFSKIKWLVSFFSSKKPKDNEGKHLINRAIYHLSDDELKEYGGRDNISDKQMPYKPYWFTYVVDSKRLIDKEYRDLLQPRGLEDDSIQPFIDSQEAEIKAIEEEITFVQSEDFEQKRVEQIVQQRLRDKVVFKDIPELVSEFERQNDLLSLIRPKSSPKKSISKPEDIMESDCQVVDENGVRKIDDESIDQLTKCVEALPQTKDFYIDDNGDYTKSRLKVHDKIIAKFKKNIVCVKNDNPIAILTGGSPASGKSTFLKTFAPYLLSDELVRVDADEIRAMLPEYKGWNATATHLETKDIVNRLLSNREVGMPCLHDLIYDGTMNSVKNYLPLIGTLKSLGYQVFIVYMDKVPYSTIRKRMLERYKSSGRFVPISVIDDFFSKGKDALNDLKNNVDGYMVVDASNNDYDVIEEGGVKLPTNREYSKLGASRNKKVEDVEFVELSPLDEMEEIKQAIIIQEMLVEGSVGEERKEIEGALKVLRRLL